MEWYSSSGYNCPGDVQHLASGGLDLSVWQQYKKTDWYYTVGLFNADGFVAYGTTDTEERAKRFAVYEAHKIVQNMVNDLAEITGEDYHLELN